MSDKKVHKGEKVTWEYPGVDSTHYLEVVVSSPYGETLSSHGAKGEKKVELAMDFSSGTHNDVPLTTSFFLVSTTGEPPSTLDTGPSLVIDTIGPPPPRCWPGDEDKPVEADYSYEEQH